MQRKSLILNQNSSKSLLDVNRGPWTKFDGDDVIQHIKDKVDEKDQQMRNKIYEKEREQSKWIQALEREKEQREAKEDQERAARRARLAKLFDDEEDLYNEDDRLDAGAAD